MGMNDLIRKLSDIVANPIEYAKKRKQNSNQPVFGYFCTYTPEEIIHAAGGVPFRIMGEKKKIENADAYLQSYACSLVRTSLDIALLGKFNFIEGAIFPHTCDSIQRLSDIWRVNAKFPFHADIVLPVKLHTQSSKDYMIEELRRFRETISSYTKEKITDEKLWQSITLYNTMRDNLKRLSEIQKNNPGLIPSVVFNDCVQAAMFMPVEEHNTLTEELLTSLDGKMSEKNPTRILLAGNLCVFPEIYGFIEAAGASVVGDDMCTGSRYFVTNIDASIDDPIEAIAERLIQRPICAAKHNPNFDRGAYLKNIVKETGAEGVIFLLLKFCDPHSFDYPYLKESVESIKIPHLFLETEMDNPALGQVKTRIEAFIEMIGENRDR